jgi:hypothetical protein
LNEDAGKVVFTDSISEGNSYNTAAQFSQTAVLFNRKLANFVIHYELNRVDGTLTTYIHIDRAASGPCVKAEVIERKF